MKGNTNLYQSPNRVIALKSNFATQSSHRKWLDSHVLAPLEVLYVRVQKYISYDVITLTPGHVNIHLGGKMLLMLL